MATDPEDVPVTAKSEKPDRLPPTERKTGHVSKALEIIDGLRARSAELKRSSNQASTEIQDGLSQMQRNATSRADERTPRDRSIIEGVYRLVQTTRASQENMGTNIEGLEPDQTRARETIQTLLVDAISEPDSDRASELLNQAMGVFNRVCESGTDRVRIQREQQRRIERAGEEQAQSANSVVLRVRDAIIDNFGERAWQECLPYQNDIDSRKLTQRVSELIGRNSPLSRAEQDYLTQILNSRAGFQQLMVSLRGEIIKDIEATQQVKPAEKATEAGAKQTAPAEAVVYPPLNENPVIQAELVQIPPEMDSNSPEYQALVDAIFDRYLDEHSSDAAYYRQQGDPNILAADERHKARVAEAEVVGKNEARGVIAEAVAEENGLPNPVDVDTGAGVEPPSATTTPKRGGKGVAASGKPPRRLKASPARGAGGTGKRSKPAQIPPQTGLAADITVATGGGGSSEPSGEAERVQLTRTERLSQSADILQTVAQTLSTNSEALTDQAANDFLNQFSRILGEPHKAIEDTDAWRARSLEEKFRDVGFALGYYLEDEVRANFLSRTVPPEVDRFLNRDLWTALNRLRGSNTHSYDSPLQITRRRGDSTEVLSANVYGFAENRIGQAPFDPQYAEVAREVPPDDPAAAQAERDRQARREFYLQAYQDSQKRLPAWVEPAPPVFSTPPQLAAEQLVWLTDTLQKTGQVAQAPDNRYGLGPVDRFDYAITDQLGFPPEVVHGFRPIMDLLDRYASQIRSNPELVEQVATAWVNSGVAQVMEDLGTTWWRDSSFRSIRDRVQVIQARAASGSVPPASIGTPGGGEADGFEGQDTTTGGGGSSEPPGEPPPAPPGSPENPGDSDPSAQLKVVDRRLQELASLLGFGSRNSGAITEARFDISDRLSRGEYLTREQVEFRGLLAEQRRLFNLAYLQPTTPGVPTVSEGGISPDQGIQPGSAVPEVPLSTGQTQLGELGVSGVEAPAAVPTEDETAASAPVARTEGVVPAEPPQTEQLGVAVAVESSSGGAAEGGETVSEAQRAVESNPSVEARRRGDFIERVLAVIEPGKGDPLPLTPQIAEEQIRWIIDKVIEARQEVSSMGVVEDSEEYPERVFEEIALLIGLRSPTFGDAGVATPNSLVGMRALSEVVDEYGQTIFEADQDAWMGLATYVNSTGVPQLLNQLFPAARFQPKASGEESTGKARAGGSQPSAEPPIDGGGLSNTGAGSPGGTPDRGGKMDRLEADIEDQRRAQETSAGERRNNPEFSAGTRVHVQGESSLMGATLTVSPENNRQDNDRFVRVTVTDGPEPREYFIPTVFVSSEPLSGEPRYPNIAVSVGMAVEGVEGNVINFDKGIKLILDETDPRLQLMSAMPRSIEAGDLVYSLDNPFPLTIEGFNSDYDLVRVSFYDEGGNRQSQTLPTGNILRVPDLNSSQHVVSKAEGEQVIGMQSERASVIISNIPGLSTAMVLQRGIQQIQGVSGAKSVGYEQGVIGLDVETENVLDPIHLIGRITTMPGQRFGTASDELRLQVETTLKVVGEQKPAYTAKVVKIDHSTVESGSGTTPKAPGLKVIEGVGRAETAALPLDHDLRVAVNSIRELDSLPSDRLDEILGSRAKEIIQVLRQRGYITDQTEDPFMLMVHKEALPPLGSPLPETVERARQAVAIIRDRLNEAGIKQPDSIPDNWIEWTDRYRDSLNEAITILETDPANNKVVLGLVKTIFSVENSSVAQEVLRHDPTWEQSLADMKGLLAEIGVEVDDFRGQRVPEGGSLGIDIATFIETPGLTHQQIIETFEPQILRGGRILQRAVVVVGTPSTEIDAKKEQSEAEVVGGNLPTDTEEDQTRTPLKVISARLGSETDRSAPLTPEEIENFRVILGIPDRDPRSHDWTTASPDLRVALIARTVAQRVAGLPADDPERQAWSGESQRWMALVHGNDRLLDFAREILGPDLSGQTSTSGETGVATGSSTSGPGRFGEVPVKEDIAQAVGEESAASTTPSAAPTEQLGSTADTGGEGAAASTGAATARVQEGLPGGPASEPPEPTPPPSGPGSPGSPAGAPEGEVASPRRVRITIVGVTNYGQALQAARSAGVAGTGVSYDKQSGLFTAEIDTPSNLEALRSQLAADFPDRQISVEEVSKEPGDVAGTQGQSSARDSQSGGGGGQRPSVRPPAPAAGEAGEPEENGQPARGSEQLGVGVAGQTEGRQSGASGAREGVVSSGKVIKGAAAAAARPVQAAGGLRQIDEAGEPPSQAENVLAEANERAKAITDQAEAEAANIRAQANARGQVELERAREEANLLRLQAQARLDEAREVVQTAGEARRLREEADKLRDEAEQILERAKARAAAPAPAPATPIPVVSRVDASVGGAASGNGERGRGGRPRNGRRAGVSGPNPDATPGAYVDVRVGEGERSGVYRRPDSTTSVRLGSEVTPVTISRREREARERIVREDVQKLLEVGPEGVTTQLAIPAEELDGYTAWINACLNESVIAASTNGEIDGPRFVDELAQKLGLGKPGEGGAVLTREQAALIIPDLLLVNMILATAERNNALFDQMTRVRAWDAFADVIPDYRRREAVLAGRNVSQLGQVTDVARFGDICSQLLPYWKTEDQRTRDEERAEEEGHRADFAQRAKQIIAVQGAIEPDYRRDQFVRANQQLTPEEAASRRSWIINRLNEAIEDTPAGQQVDLREVGRRLGLEGPDFDNLTPEQRLRAIVNVVDSYTDSFSPEEKRRFMDFYGSVGVDITAADGTVRHGEGYDFWTRLSETTQAVPRDDEGHVGYQELIDHINHAPVWEGAPVVEPPFNLANLSEGEMRQWLAQQRLLIGGQTEGDIKDIGASETAQFQTEVTVDAPKNLSRNWFKRAFQLTTHALNPWGLPGRLGRALKVGMREYHLTTRRDKAYKEMNATVERVASATATGVVITPEIMREVNTRLKSGEAVVRRMAGGGERARELGMTDLGDSALGDYVRDVVKGLVGQLTANRPPNGQTYPPARLLEWQAQVQVEMAKYVHGHPSDPNVITFFGRDKNGFNKETQSFASNMMEYAQKIAQTQHANALVLGEFDELIKVDAFRARWGEETELKLGLHERLLKAAETNRALGLIVNPITAGILGVGISRAIGSIPAVAKFGTALVVGGGVLGAAATGAWIPPVVGLATAVGFQMMRARYDAKHNLIEVARQRERSQTVTGAGRSERSVYDEMLQTKPDFVGQIKAVDLINGSGDGLFEGSRHRRGSFESLINELTTNNANLSDFRRQRLQEELARRVAETEGLLNLPIEKNGKRVGIGFLRLDDTVEGGIEGSRTMLALYKVKARDALVSSGWAQSQEALDTKLTAEPQDEAPGGYAYQVEKQLYRSQAMIDAKLGQLQNSRMVSAGITAGVTGLLLGWGGGALVAKGARAIGFDWNLTSGERVLGALWSKAHPGEALGGTQTVANALKELYSQPDKPLPQGGIELDKGLHLFHTADRELSPGPNHSITINDDNSGLTFGLDKDALAPDGSIRGLKHITGTGLREDTDRTAYDQIAARINNAGKDLHAEVTSVTEAGTKSLTQIIREAVVTTPPNGKVTLPNGITAVFDGGNGGNHVGIDLPNNGGHFDAFVNKDTGVVDIKLPVGADPTAIQRTLEGLNFTVTSRPEASAGNMLDYITAHAREGASRGGNVFESTVQEKTPGGWGFRTNLAGIGYSHNEQQLHFLKGGETQFTGNLKGDMLVDPRPGVGNINDPVLMRLAAKAGGIHNNDAVTVVRLMDGKEIVLANNVEGKAELLKNAPELFKEGTDQYDPRIVKRIITAVITQPDDSPDGKLYSATQLAKDHGVPKNVKFIALASEKVGEGMKLDPPAGPPTTILTAEGKDIPTVGVTHYSLNIVPLPEQAQAGPILEPNSYVGDLLSSSTFVPRITVEPPETAGRGNRRRSTPDRDSDRSADNGVAPWAERLYDALPGLWPTYIPKTSPITQAERDSASFKLAEWLYDHFPGIRPASPSRVPGVPSRGGSAGGLEEREIEAGLVSALEEYGLSQSEAEALAGQTIQTVRQGSPLDSTLDTRAVPLEDEDEAGTLRSEQLNQSIANAGVNPLALAPVLNTWMNEYPENASEIANLANLAVSLPAPSAAAQPTFVNKFKDPFSAAISVATPAGGSQNINVVTKDGTVHEIARDTKNNIFAQGRGRRTFMTVAGLSIKNEDVVSVVGIGPGGRETIVFARSAPVQRVVQTLPQQSTIDRVRALRQMISQKPVELAQALDRLGFAIILKADGEPMIISKSAQAPSEGLVGTINTGGAGAVAGAVASVTGGAVSAPTQTSTGTTSPTDSATAAASAAAATTTTTASTAAGTTGVQSTASAVNPASSSPQQQGFFRRALGRVGIGRPKRVVASNATTERRTPQSEVLDSQALTDAANRYLNEAEERIRTRTFGFDDLIGLRSPRETYNLGIILEAMGDKRLAVALKGASPALIDHISRIRGQGAPDIRVLIDSTSESPDQTGIAREMIVERLKARLAQTNGGDDNGSSGTSGGTQGVGGSLVRPPQLSPQPASGGGAVGAPTVPQTQSSAHTRLAAARDANARVVAAAQSNRPNPPAVGGALTQNSLGVGQSPQIPFPSPGAGTRGASRVKITPDVQAAFGLPPLPDVTTGLESRVEMTPVQFQVGFTDAQGKRPTMEDTHVAIQELRPGVPSEGFYGIFDGHGGRQVADLVAQQLPGIFAESLNRNPFSPYKAMDEAYKIMDEAIRGSGFGNETGATAVTVYRYGNSIVVGNVGDARAVMVSEGGFAAAKRLSYDHKASDINEINRIKNTVGPTGQKGVVLEDDQGVKRVGRVAVARAFGDWAEKPFISAEPTLNQYNLTPENKYIIIACDGLWDAVTDNEAAQVVSQARSAQEASQMLKDLALRNNSSDNISVMVLDLQPGIPAQAPRPF